MAQSKQTFSDLGQDRVNFAREEEKILQYWRDIDAFKQQLKVTEGQKPWTFYELSGTWLNTTASIVIKKAHSKLIFGS